MKRNFGVPFSLIVVAALLVAGLSLVFFLNLGKGQENEVYADHTHCVCGLNNAAHTSVGDHTDYQGITWTAWSTANSLPSEGYYYLTTDVTLTGQKNVEKELHLCLNGHTIKRNVAGRLFRVSADTGKLEITNCGSSGGLLIPAGTYKDHSAVWAQSGDITMYRVNMVFTGLILKEGVIFVGSGRTLKLYACDVAGGEAAKIDDTTNGSGQGGIIRSAGAAYLYNCTLHDGHAVYGAGIFLSGSGSLVMNDSTLKDCVSGSNGGGIYCSEGSSISISNSTISDCVSTGGVGGGVYSKNATLNLNAGTIIEDCSLQGSKKNGGGICAEGGILNVSGAIIRNNTSTNVGGNVAATGGIAFSMTSGEIYGGKNGTNLNSASSNIHYYNNNGTFRMTGGQIYGRFNVMASKDFLVTGTAKIYDEANLSAGLSFTNTYCGSATDYSRGFTVRFKDTDEGLSLQEGAQINISSVTLTGNQTAVLEKNENATDYAANMNNRLSDFDYRDKKYLCSSGLTIAVMDTDSDAVADSLFLYGKTSENGHAHCVCGGTLTDGQVLGAGTDEEITHRCADVIWSAVTSKPTSSGYYYCNADTLSGTGMHYYDVDINLCLNGKQVTYSSARLYSGHENKAKSSITLTDCGESGSLTQKYTSAYSQGVLLWCGASHSADWTIYAGTYDLSETAMSVKNGGGSIAMDGSVNFNLFGGTIIGRAANETDFSETLATQNHYGNISISSKSKMNMYGGTLTGGVASRNGGNILMTGGTLNIFGGTISGGKAHVGGNICVNSGTVNMYGGTISGGEAKLLSDYGDTNIANDEYASGNVHLANGTRFYLYGGTIEGGVSEKHGGNIRVNGQLHMSGGTVKDGTATNSGGNIFVNIGNAATNSTNGIFTMSGGTVKDGTCGGGGGNICGNGLTTYYNSLITISGGTISQPVGRKAAVGGSNISSSGTLVITGGTITGGASTKNGGSISLVGAEDRKYPLTFTMTGGTIEGGQDDTSGGNLFAYYADVNIIGGTIRGGSAPKAGNIFVNANSTLNLSGENTLITGGTATTQGGNIYTNGTTTIGNATISLGTTNGTAKENGGGNIYNTGTLTINGASILNGSVGDITLEATAAYGGNIFNQKGATCTINDGLISGGSANSGGNILNRGTMTVHGGTATGGTAAAAGGNLRQDDTSAIFTMYGGEFLNGSSLSESEVQNVFLHKGSFSISDGVFDGAEDKINFFAREDVTNSSITGGYFKGLLGGAKLGTAEAAYIRGGYFTVEPERKLIDIHKAAKPLATPVVKDGVTYGFSLVEALVVSTSSAVPKSGETGVAALTGAGSIAIGDTVTLTAPEMASGYHFLGWYKDAYSVEASPIDDGAKTITLKAGTDFNADTDYVAAYQLDAAVYTLTVNGSMFTITVDEKVVSYVEGGIKIESGAEVVLTYAGDESEMDFHGWQNLSGKTLTSSGEYSFKMLKDTEIKANEAAKNVKTIVFTNGSGQVLYSLTGTLDALPALPIRVGYDSEWSKTLEEINDPEEKYILVAAIFTKKETAQYTVTIKDVREGEANVSRILDPVDLGSRVLLTAAAYEGYKFAYFKDADGKPLSYTAPVYSIFGKDTTVYAVYVLEEASVVKKPTMNLAETVEETAGGKITKFTATRDIPEGYTLLEHGILYQVGVKTEAQMNYGDSRKAISDATGMLGTVSLNVGLVPNGYSITARGYAIIKNAAGETSYLYSDIITITAAAANP